jgi:nicotinamidase-related amidase
MHFSSLGTTINSNEIIKAITQHGIPVFHISDTHLKPFLYRESAYKRVNPKIAMEYLETYRNTCEYFYRAAKKFSQSYT